MPAEYLTLWFCQDCTIAECNGDYSGMEDARAAEVAAGLSALSQSGHLAANWDSETGDGQEDFSRRQCDGCGTALHGYRARFAQFTKGGV